MMTKLKENKDRFIRQNPKLTTNQKVDILDFFHKHPEQEGKIKDWNTNIPYETFNQVIKSYNKRFLPKWKLEDLKEGVDYDYLTKDKVYTYYIIYTYKASVAFASNNIGPQYYSDVPNWYSGADGFKNNLIKDYPEVNSHSYGGAKWCISMNHTRIYWDDYITDSDGSDIKMVFVFAISNNVNDQTDFCKLAICVSSEWNEIEDIYSACDERLESDDIVFYVVNKTLTPKISSIDISKIKIVDYHKKMLDSLISEADKLEEEYVSKYGRDVIDVYNELLGREVNGKYWTDTIIDDLITKYFPNSELIHDFNGCKDYLINYIKEDYQRIDKTYLPNVKTVNDLIDYAFDFDRILHTCNYPYFVVAVFVAKYMDYFGNTSIRDNFPEFHELYKKYWGDENYSLKYAMNVAHNAIRYYKDSNKISTDLLNFMKEHVTEKEFFDIGFINDYKIIEKSGKAYCFKQV